MLLKCSYYLSQEVRENLPEFNWGNYTEILKQWFSVFYRFDNLCVSAEKAD
jgi:hypothetical protein